MSTTTIGALPTALDVKQAAGAHTFDGDSAQASARRLTLAGRKPITAVDVTALDAVSSTNGNVFATTPTGDALEIWAPWGGSDVRRFVVATAPAQPYRVTAHCHWWMRRLDHNRVGMGLMSSGNAGMLLLEIGRSGGVSAPRVVEVNHWTSNTTFGAVRFSRSILNASPPTWLRFDVMDDVATFYYSWDGLTWLPMTSRTISDAGDAGKIIISERPAISTVAHNWAVWDHFSIDPIVEDAEAPGTIVDVTLGVFTLTPSDRTTADGDVRTDADGATRVAVQIIS